MALTVGAAMTDTPRDIDEHQLYRGQLYRRTRANAVRARVWTQRETAAGRR
jgi:hypothetical protein